MKTTVELPDKLLKTAKTVAAKRGISVKQLMIEALSRIVAHDASTSLQPEWMRVFGAFKGSEDETSSIQHLIDQEFSRIDKESWR